jgi:hypothetical protein
MRSVRSLFLVGLLLAAFALGCGSSSPSTSPPTDGARPSGKDKANPNKPFQPKFQ